MREYNAGDRVVRTDKDAVFSIKAGMEGTVTDHPELNGVMVRWDGYSGPDMWYDPSEGLIRRVPTLAVTRTVIWKAGEVHLLANGDTFDVRSPGQVEATFNTDQIDDIIAVLTAYKEEL